MMYRDKTYKDWDKKYYEKEVEAFLKTPKADAVSVCLLCLAVAAALVGLFMYWHKQDVKNYQRNKTIVAQRLASNAANDNAGQGFGGVR